MIKAVILGGQGEKTNKDLNNKAMVRIRDKAMICYVIDALRDTPSIGDIFVVGDVAELEKLDLDEAVQLLQSKPSLIDNVTIALEALKGEKILLSTSDIPLITKDAIEDFVTQGLAVGGELCYSIISKERIEAKYPDAKRTYAKLAEGYYTGGNLFLLDTTKVLDHMVIGRKMLENRKNPVKMGKLLGFKILLKLLLGKLTIGEIENRVRTQMGILGKAIISNYPEVGNDVDKLEDILLAEKYIL